MINSQSDFGLDDTQPRHGLENFNEKKYQKKRIQSALPYGRPKSGKAQINIVSTSMENYSEYSKRLYQSIDQWNSKRAKSAKPVSIHGLKYKFKIMDLNKYKDSMKYGHFDWPI